MTGVINELVTIGIAIFIFYGYRRQRRIDLKIKLYNEFIESMVLGIHDGLHFHKMNALYIQISIVADRNLVISITQLMSTLEKCSTEKEQSSRKIEIIKNMRKDLGVQGRFSRKKLDGKDIKFYKTHTN